MAVLRGLSDNSLFKRGVLIAPIRKIKKEIVMNELQELFSLTERAILFDYFKIPRPEYLKGIDIREQPNYGGLWINKDLDRTGYALDAVVAQIALSAIQERLPQCGVVSDDKVTLLRKPFTPPSPAVVLFPQFLFTINWADSAPGISWPESYHITYIPGFERYVVTASQDSTDVWGVTELAIGDFSIDNVLTECAEGAITDWWSNQHINNCQEKWEYVWDEGIINTETANKWADSVWVTHHEEDYEGEEV